MVSRRSLLKGAAAAAAVGSQVVPVITKRSGKTKKTHPVLVGTLVTDEAHVATEVGDGIDRAMQEVFWDRWETSQGVWSSSYETEVSTRFNALRNAGAAVTLAFGTYAPPAWVFSAVANSRYVDQNDATSSQLNVVFNQAVRDRVQSYIERIDAVLGLKNFWAIRLTSGGHSEMLYPGGTGLFWAYDVNAQNGAGRPSNMDSCPHPGWKPGQTTITIPQVREWADWYVKGLCNVTEWFVSVCDGLGFTGWYQCLTPGSGTRESYYTADINSRLTLNYPTAVGAVWHRYYEQLATHNRKMVYISSVADDSGGNDSGLAGDTAVDYHSATTDSWSAVRWQSLIAKTLGMPAGGENPGYDQPPDFNVWYADVGPGGMMDTAFRQATTCGLNVFYWAHDERLWPPLNTAPYANFLNWKRTWTGR